MNEKDDVTVREAINTALGDLLEEDERVFLMGEDIEDPMGGSFKVTAGLSTKFGRERVRNTPISEAAIVGAAIGAAVVGCRPIAEIMYIDFVTLAMDQIVNQAALMSYMSGGQVSVPLVVRCQGGALKSSAAQHSKSLESWLAHVPGLKVVVPSTANDAYWLLRAAVEDPNPVVFYEAHRLYRSTGSLDRENRPSNLMSAVIRKVGSDGTIVTWGGMVDAALEAAAALEQSDGISLEVIDQRWLAPLDCTVAMKSAARTRRLAVLHEAWRVGGLGGEIAATVGEQLHGALVAPIRRFGARHCPHPFAPGLERAVIPSVGEIVDGLQAWFSPDGGFDKTCAGDE